MPPPRQLVEFPIAGLAEGDDQKTIQPGALTLAVNIEFDKRGAISKRRGYQHVDIGQDVRGFQAEQTFCNVGVYFGEIVLFGHQHLHALLDADALMYQGGSPGKVVAQRGDIPRGTLARQDVASSQTTNATYEEGGGG